MPIVYLNGDFIPQEKATISIMDRGFLFGDGIYEVVPIFNGQLFGFEEHMVRFDNSLREIYIKNPLSHIEWKHVFKTLMHENNVESGNYNCYCQVTRGADTTRNHTFPNNLIPTTIAFITPAKFVNQSILENGFSAITLEDTRRKDCYVKAIALLPNILQMQKAKEASAIEAILIRDNEVLECTSSNVFIVKDGTILTPPLSSYILHGVTRQLVIQLALENNIPLKETSITLEALKAADEVWITGSSKEICPIIKVDDTLIGFGKVGPMWHAIKKLYDTYKHTMQEKISEANND